MAKKKNALLKWMQKERITQRWLSEYTDINQASISAHCRGMKVSDHCLCLYKETQYITELPEDVLNTIKNQHL